MVDRSAGTAAVRRAVAGQPCVSTRPWNQRAGKLDERGPSMLQKSLWSPGWQKSGGDPPTTQMRHLPQRACVQALGSLRQGPALLPGFCRSDCNLCDQRCQIPCKQTSRCALGHRTEANASYRSGTRCGFCNCFARQTGLSDRKVAVAAAP